MKAICVVVSFGGVVGGSVRKMLFPIYTLMQLTLMLHFV